MSRQEFLQWQAYIQLDPWDREVTSLYLAQLTTRIANYMRPASHSGYHLKDFLLDFLTDPDETTPHNATTPEQQYALLEHMTRATGGKIFDGDVSDDEMEAYVMSHRPLDDDMGMEME